jgi:hypothetical protein
LKNILKIVFLSIVGFSFLIYFTIPENKSEKNIRLEQKVENLPKNFEVYGDNIAKESIFSKNSYIVLLNHDSLAVFKDLYKKTNKNIILIANVSNTPWIIKNIAVNSELQKLYKDSKIGLINDENGYFRRFFDIKNDEQNIYFVYKIEDDLSIKEIVKAYVKKGALQNGVLDTEIDKSLEDFLANLK